jgi:hypothetical protein
MSASPLAEKKSNFWRNLLIALGVIFAAGLFFVAVVVILIWQSVAWLQNAPESKMARYEELKLSPGEEEDVARVIAGVNEAKKEGSVYDEYVTPRVFDGAMERILEDERRKGKAKPDSPLAVRGAFTDGHMSLRLTLPKVEQNAGAPQPKSASPPEPRYINAEAVFDLEIVEGEVTRANVHKLVLRRREAPWLPLMVVRYMVGKAKEKSQKEKDDPVNPFWAIKLLRREGDRLHIMLDGARMKEQETHR